MRLIDLNILLYAVNADAPRHAAARRWVEEVMTEDSVGLPWVVMLGFLRLATSRQVFTHPMAAQEAIDIVDGWLQRPNVVALAPGRDHWVILRSLVSASGMAGNLTTDAHLAALAIEHGCQLCSTDTDFARFPRLDWENPL
jgi:toxin-antitoxin system PIN domain toxin